jgi:ATP-dependent protease ClpP protease subunit
MIRLPSNLARLRAAWRSAEGVEPIGSACFQVFNVEQVPRLYVSGLIGGLDSDAADFVATVHGIKAKQIHLHINSVGGFVWDAVAMHEALVSHPARVVTHVDGLAASAASFLALAGDDVETARGSRWMIHDAQVIAFGSPAEVREAADLGDAVSDDIASIYAARAGGKPAAWRKAMTATTWYSAEQAVDAGLAHRVSGNSDTTNSGASNRSRLIKARAAVALGGVVK